MVRLAGLLTASLFASGVTACGSQCDRNPDEPPVVFTDGTTDQTAHVYTSSPNAKNPWAGPWLNFPPGRTYRFPHHLGGVPRDLEVMFSFSATPTTFVHAAGNQATWQNPGPENMDLRNDTCSDVYVMVRLSDPAPIASSSGARDAGID